jgi:hypothetical protein
MLPTPFLLRVVARPVRIFASLDTERQETR